MKKKDRKHSGWITPQLTIPKKELIKNNLFVQDYYDDWQDYRDGMRGYDDRKKIQYSFLEDIKKYNNKQKLLLLRRKAKKSQKRFINKVLK